MIALLSALEQTAEFLVEFETWRFDGYLMQTTDRAGRITDYTYAPTRKLTFVTQYLEQNGSNVPVQIAYDFDEYPTGNRPFQNE